MPRLVTPGCTTARRLATSTASTSRIRCKPTTTPSATGSAPPESPVPAPRATNGTPASWQARTTAATSSVVAGSATAEGETRTPVRPSHAYVASWAGAVSSQRSPTMRRSSSRIGRVAMATA